MTSIAAMTALRPADLARRWQCSERTVRNLIATGALPAFRLGGKLLRISHAAVERFEQCQNIDSSASEDKFAVTWHEGGRRFRHSLGVDSRAEADQRLARFIAAQAAASAVAKGSAYTVADAWAGYTKALGAKPIRRHRLASMEGDRSGLCRAQRRDADRGRLPALRRRAPWAGPLRHHDMVGTKSPAISAQMGREQATDRPGSEDMATGAVTAARQADDAGTSLRLHRRLHASARQALCDPRRDDRRSHGRDSVADVGPSRP